ncbi:hypothetical protein PHPALM_20637 [Phytophthora palmivora]|uniref:Uncharacterized protein n=1 Tax=Phytophthora palmivora TaxID=4796 RepID=A0A2P4XEE0_9STRA|nr:hypothetical protein PHPALM_20637 [Phytophthora palmivora]
MGCAVDGCQEADELKRDPCSVCGKLTHHICAIGVFEGADSAPNERFCCLECVQVVYPNAGASTSAAASFRPDTSTYSRAPPPNIWAGSDFDFVPSRVLPGDDTTTTEERVSKRRKTSAASKTVKSKMKKAHSTKAGQPSPGVLLSTPTYPPASPVSELGVPLSVRYSRKAGTTDDVWDLYRDICILCCQAIQARTRTNSYIWEEALRNTNLASNVKDQIKAKHADHPLPVLAEMKTTQKAMDDVISAEVDVQTVLDLTGSEYTSDATAAATATGTTTASVVAVTTVPTNPSKRYFKANENTLNVLISKWLISKGFPYTACVCASFEDIMRANTDDRVLNGQFQLFCDLVGELLASEFQKACGLKFRNLMHHIWTNCEKVSITGASIAFIDSLWRFRFTAVMASVKNDGHHAPLVANVIAKSFKLKYDVDIKMMTRFTMSDTTPSAKNVADLIDTEQEDCSMHLLNLRISYDIGLKHNIQTVSVWNDSTVTWDKVVTKVTPGGSFDEGGDTPKQRNALRKIQLALSYPKLDPLTDNDVRVAYTCKLIRRSVVNYASFEAYFQSTKDPANAWAALTAKDWMLVVEIEAVTSFISSLALVETQSKNLVSSYMVVFRRLAETKLKSVKFDAMAMETPRSKDANESSHRRVVRMQQQFPMLGKLVSDGLCSSYKHASQR